MRGPNPRETRSETGCLKLHVPSFVVFSLKPQGDRRRATPQGGLLALPRDRGEHTQALSLSRQDAQEGDDVSRDQGHWWPPSLVACLELSPGRLDAHAGRGGGEDQGPTLSRSRTQVEACVPSVSSPVP